MLLSLNIFMLLTHNYMESRSYLCTDCNIETSYNKTKISLCICALISGTVYNLYNLGL